MRASQNELNSLLKQAFEGCGLDYGAYESAAELVLWSQAHGFDGFACLEGALQQCLQTPNARLTIKQDQAEFYEMDMLGDSVLLCGAPLNDLAIVKAMESGVCVSQIVQVHDRVLLAKLLADARQQGLYGIAYWTKNNLSHVMKSGEHDYPDYFQFAVAKNHKESESQTTVSEAQGLTLVYARVAHKIDQHLDKLWAENGACEPCHSSSQCEQRYQNALGQGLEISDSLWATLIQVAANVLVESTEQSRMGAGA